MRASTIFILIIAILLGLTGIVVARAAGLFEPKQQVAAAPTPVKTYQILVAQTNIFKDQPVMFAHVKVATVTETEYKDLLDKGKEDEKALLPANVNAVNRKLATMDIRAETPLRWMHLRDIDGGYRTLDKVLLPGARAVRLAIDKTHSAGCAFELDDYVDVVLTAAAYESTTGGTVNRSAVIARNLKVIGKQGSLNPISKTLSTKCPCTYLLEANPYRAGLIEYAKGKGIISLMPASSTHETDLLDKRREDWRDKYHRSEGVPNRPGWELAGTGPFIVLDVESIKPSEEFYKSEPPRVRAYHNNEYVISEADLARLFHLKETELKQPIKVKSIIGNKYAGEHVFPQE